MSQIYCPIRKLWVAALPEEIIRQGLVAHMIQNLGFPASLIVLEKELRQMPHLNLKNQKVPDRRADIVCFAPNIHPAHALYPLLLVECKAVKLTDKVINQVVGYNHYLKACFIAIANEQTIRLGWYSLHAQSYTFIDTLPPYPELLRGHREVLTTEAQRTQRKEDTEVF